MHPGLGSVNFEQAAQVGLQFAAEQIAKLYIMVAHMTQMAGIMALVQKVEERHLLQQRKVHIERAPHEQERLEENGGCDQVAQAQRGKEHFAKSADIEHPPVVIQSLEGLQRAPTKAVFAIIVVLQNPCPSLPGPVQQADPARKAHSYPRGE